MDRSPRHSRGREDHNGTSTTSRDSRSNRDTESKRKHQDASTTDPKRPRTQDTSPRSSSSSTSTSSTTTTSSSSVASSPSLQASSRTVPPSVSSPSPVLLITGFVRPFTLPAVKDLVTRASGSENTQLVDFWMNPIKTHCYVVYENEEQAKNARQELFGLVWPPQNKATLHAAFSSMDDITLAKEGKPANARQPPDSRSNTNNNSNSNKNTSSSSSTEGNTDARTVYSNGSGGTRGVRGRGDVAQQRSDPLIQKVKILEDLFRHTATSTPKLYWLPLTDEQVQEKKSAGNIKPVEPLVIRR